MFDGLIYLPFSNGKFDIIKATLQKSVAFIEALLPKVAKLKHSSYGKLRLRRRPR